MLLSEVQALNALGTKKGFCLYWVLKALWVLLFPAEITYIKYVEIRQFTEAKQIIFLFNLFSKIKKVIDFRLYKFNWNKADA